MAGVPRVRLPAAYRAAARRSVRVTLAGSAGFYLFLYGFGSAVAATYAVFAAVAMAGLSRIPGTGRQRAAMLLRLVPACWVLITIGTYLAVRTWSAALGMLVVGFALAFTAVGGPRPAGAAPGLQLMYILPSFPPYDPGSLGERLAGATTGLALLVVAEALLLPDPPTVPYRELAARAADSAQRCADELTSASCTLSDGTLREAREASTGLRSSLVPEAERPAGASVRDRALTHTGLSLRTLLSRLPLLPPVPAGPDPSRAGLDALRAVRDAAEETAVLLRGRAPAGDAHAELLRARSALAAGPAADASPAVLRRHVAVLEAADAALAMSTAAWIAVRGRAGAPRAAPGRFWYASTPAPQLWWRRLEGHAGGRSVFFQNAVRISLALAAARVIAGADSLPHGFWVLLATLTLTRTTVRETRSTVRVALTGTLIGALIVAGLLALVGTDTTVYAAALPPLMLVAFTLGPVKGVGWAQAMFTLVVALVFAQLAPATWQLAEVRLLDVLTGSAIGAVFGLLAWPRGAQDELRRSVAVMLRSAAEAVVATTAQLAAGGVRNPVLAAPGHRSLQHAVILAESAYAQFQSEPKEPAVTSAGQDWQATLMAGHHTLWGAVRLLAPPERVDVPPLGREPAATVTRLGDRVAGRMLLVSARLDPSGDTPEGPVPLRDPESDGFAAEPPGATTLYYGAAAWLDSLMTDLERITGQSGDGRAGPG
ncbi:MULTISPECIES: FUSC family protein [unclassified Streptomyces]|uniref:FUSC family protein n=1 Tax=unclassified Streptomyces TaxID=2593676 RepID=UPI002258BA1B|nr:FUSC family protein [Streptomyces sp. NBC_00047]MCX5610337.1 FUSC family protein [Streptomyces sp. NBC_00047]